MSGLDTSQQITDDESLKEADENGAHLEELVDKGGQSSNAAEKQQPAAEPPAQG